MAWGGWSGASGQIEFDSVGAARGIEAYAGAPGLSTGFAAADYEDDGDVDLFVPNRDGVADQLYRNLGGGVYEEVGASLGVASVENARSGLWVDYDGDGRLDIVVAHDVHQQDAWTITSTLRLYRQEVDGTFTDVTSSAGLLGVLEPGVNGHAGGVSAGDLNNDGWLDLCLAYWEGTARVFLNEGDGTFTEISAACGIGTSVGNTWTPVMYDLDGDRLTDVLLSHDFFPNQLWMNEGGLSFVDEASAAGVDTAFNEMGIGLGDPDNDGDVDVYMTNIYEVDQATGEQQYNVLFRNDSAGGVVAFTEIAQAAGVDNGGIGWGTAFFDADNDGWEDLAESNSVEFTTSVPTKLWRNPADGTLVFTDISASAGFAFEDRGTSLVSYDSDRDGDEDLVQAVLFGPLRLLENLYLENGGTNGWLVVRTRMPGANSRGIGSVVRATAGGLEQMRVITAGISFAGQEPAEAFFGLGGAGSADVVVEWPNGMRTELEGVSAGQVVTVTSPCACGSEQYDVDGDGGFDVDDLSALEAGGADVNFDGVVDAVDAGCLEAWLRMGEVGDVTAGR